MNKNLIKIEVPDISYSEIIKILINNNIYYKSLEIKDKNITLQTDKDGYKIIKNYNKETKIIKHLGINGIKEFVKKHYILLISFLITYIMLLVLSNIIFDIEIISTNSELKRVINLYLEENDIKKYKFMKQYEELNEIKKKILEENKTTLEWIEIERIGTKYIINLTERIVNNNILDTTPKDIVASKDALIMYLVTKNGTRMKEVNELVKKGEVIISGNIIKNEHLVDTVAASGDVYGEVWYTVKTTVPYKFTEYEKTGEIVNHIYLDLFGKKITLMGYYETALSLNETKALIDKPYLFFKVYKERKELYKYETHKLSKKEAEKEAIKRSDKSIENKLKSDERILDKKVLKINHYSSKIEIEVFYRVYENIGEAKELTPYVEPEGE